MVEFLIEIWEFLKKNRYIIFLYFMILFILSYLIGIGVKYFPNLGTYGSAREWFGFWGNVVGGITTALIAAIIAYFVSKKENEKNNVEQKRIEEREEKIIKETALMKIKISSIKKCIEYIDRIENITKPINSWLDLYEAILISDIDSANKSIQISQLEVNYITLNLEVNIIINKMKSLLSLSLIVDSDFYLDEYEEKLNIICVAASTLKKEFVKDIVPGNNVKSINLSKQISGFISDKKEYEDSLKNLKNELINNIKNL